MAKLWEKRFVGVFIFFIAKNIFVIFGDDYLVNNGAVNIPDF